jgi:N-methylhydantoinase B
MAADRIDPVTLSVLWNGLLSAADEMGSTLRRTAFSEAVREGDDFSTGLFDAGARLIAQGNFTPGHLGAMPYVIRNVLSFHPPESFEPGDSVLLNDSFLGSGHFPDCFLVTPVFEGETILGYAVNTAHHVDVGGAAPGSQVVHGVTEAFQEGLRILPVKLVRRGRIDPDVMRLIEANVRIPEKVRGDLMAQMNANLIGADRLRRLHSHYGSETVAAAIEEILRRSEQRMRSLIGRMPRGRYSFVDHLDDCGPGTDPIRVAVTVTVGKGELTVDFSDSSDQVAAGINAYLNYTRAYTMFAVKIFADAKLPQNDGVIRAVNVVSRPGSFFNPQFPAPSGGRAAVQIRIFEAINGALAQALPGKAMGAFSHWSNPNIGGTDDRTGRRFVLYDLIFGGYGARSTKDGAEALSPVLNCANIPVEVHEVNNPVLVHRLELIPDSGGAGRFRGGCGLRKDIEIGNSRALVTLLGDRQRFAPYGLFGGASGAKAQTVLTRKGRARRLGSKEVVPLEKGDVLSFRLAGGGGYGDPKARSVEAIESDVADGYVTPAAARASYPQYRAAAPRNAGKSARGRKSR